MALCDRLVEFVDFEMSETDAEEFRAHIHSCVSCQERLPGEVMLRERLAGLGATIEPDPAWQAQVFSRIRRLEVHQRRLLWVSGIAAVVLAVIAWLIGGGL